MSTTQARKRGRGRGRGRGGTTPPAAPAVAVQPVTAPAKPIRVAERFELLEYLGRGSYKWVWKALDHATGQHIALAMYAPHEDYRRFLARHQRIAAQVAPHPNLVSVLDVGEGEYADGSTVGWIAMDLLSPASVPAITAIRRWRGPAPVPTIIRFLYGTVSALAHLHHAGVVHGSPHGRNLLTGPDGWATLIDFDWTMDIGGVTRIEPDEIVTLIDQAQTTPESLSGGLYDEKSDIYLAASACYLVAVGGHPFATGDFMGRLTTLPATPRQLNPALPESVSDLLMAMLTPDPRARPTVAEARDTLGKLPFEWIFD